MGGRKEGRRGGDGGSVVAAGGGDGGGGEGGEEVMGMFLLVNLSGGVDADGEACSAAPV